MTIATTMLPVACSTATRLMNRAWKIGVNRKAKIENGSEGLAGWRAMAAGGVVATGVGVGDWPGARVAAGPPSGAQAASTRTAKPTSRATASHGRSWSWRRMDEIIIGSAHRVVATGVSGMASADPASAHVAAFQEAVALDGLLRVVRAGGLI